MMVSGPFATRFFYTKSNSCFTFIEGISMRDDAATTVAELKEAIERFAEARDWKQFHDPKNLAMALASEVGELMEHFRWLTNDQSKLVALDPEILPFVESELADVVMLALEFAVACKIDVAGAVRMKLSVNEERYPIDKAKGSNRKYNRL
jgi:NTP pyrophosphatase (non-canonical NTP hydrolase)